MPLLDVLDPERRLLGLTPRGPLCLPPGGAHWYVVRESAIPDPATFLPTYGGSRRGSTAARRARHPPERTVLGGFSQGAVMSYALALGRGRPRPAAMVALSGFVPTVEGFELDLEPPLPPVAIGHGTLDPIIGVEFGRRARDAARGGGRGRALPRVADAAHDRPALPAPGARLAHRARRLGGLTWPRS